MRGNWDGSGDVLDRRDEIRGNVEMFGIDGLSELRNVGYLPPDDRFIKTPRIKVRLYRHSPNLPSETVVHHAQGDTVVFRNWWVPPTLPSLSQFQGSLNIDCP
jgi:hypothetical protein